MLIPIHSQRSRVRLSMFTTIVIAVGSLCAVAGVAFYFAHHQSLWFDEVSHMRGLQLGPIEVARWLQGERPHRFLIPADRNPPLSYWSGQAWTSVVGYGEFNLRAMGVLLLLASVGLMLRAGWTIGGNVTALLSALLFGLSPNVLDSAVEIRSYGVWLFLASAAWYQFIRLAAADTPSTRRFLAMTILCLASSYTHFFGVVQSTCLLTVSGVVLLIRNRGAWRWVLFATALYGIGLLGLIPFIRWAITHVAGAEAELDPLTTGFGYGLRRMIYRLVGHPAASVYPTTVGALFLGYCCAALLVVWQAVRPAAPDGRAGTTGNNVEVSPFDAPQALRRIGALTLLVLGLGLVANITGRLAVTSFDPLRSRYSLWMLPGVVLLAVSGIGIGLRGSKLANRCAWLTTALLLGATCGTTVVFVQHVDQFTHGPHRQLLAMIEEQESLPIVIYEPSRVWGFGYIPLLYEYGRELSQYRAITLGEGVEASNIEYEHLQGPVVAMPPTDLPVGARICLVQLESLGQRELREEIRGRRRDFEDGPVLNQLRHRPEWKVISEFRFVSYTACRAVVLEHVARPRELSSISPADGPFYQIDKIGDASIPSSSVGRRWAWDLR